MFAWLSQNLATLLICAGLLLIVFFILRSMVKDKRAGKSSCGGSCACCPMGGSCTENAGGRKGPSRDRKKKTGRKA